MRALAERHAAKTVFGIITPDCIFIGGDHNIRIEKPASCREEYIAPEIQTGLPPDYQADIYSMGVILFELVTGTLEFVEKNLKKRYRTTDDISAALLKIKGAVTTGVARPRGIP